MVFEGCALQEFWAYIVLQELFCLTGFCTERVLAQSAVDCDCHIPAYRAREALDQNNCAQEALDWIPWHDSLTGPGCCECSQLHTTGCAVNVSCLKPLLLRKESCMFTYCALFVTPITARFGMQAAEELK
jgi:hypothetical protein